MGYLGAKVFDAATQMNKGQFFSYGWPADKSVGLCSRRGRRGLV